MGSHYDRKTVIKVDRETQMVSLSIKVNDHCVNVYKISVAEFNILIGEYNSQLLLGNGYIPVEESNLVEGTDEIEGEIN